MKLKVSIVLLALCATVCLAGVPAARTDAATAGTASSGSSDGGSSSDASDTITQSYDAGPTVLSGMIVELETKNQSTVVPAPSKDINHTLGVVVPVSDADIVLTPPASKSQQVLVAATGRYNVLVSDQNGPIKTGDYLTLSAIDGIAMKAGSQQQQVVGRAEESFTGQSNIIETVKLKSSLGRTKTVAISQVLADVRLAPNPLYRNSTNLPRFLKEAANSVANKKVNTVRVYLSVGVLAATLFITGVMLYGGIRGGVTAIGRNPLAKKAVSQGLAQAIMFGLIIFILGMLASYAILI